MFRFLVVILFTNFPFRLKLGYDVSIVPKRERMPHLYSSCSAVSFAFTRALARSDRLHIAAIIVFIFLEACLGWMEVKIDFASFP